MSRAPLLAAPALASLVFPAAAFAAESGTLGQRPTELVVSLVGLGVAMVLLLEALSLRKVALGGAIAEKISYVVLATVCLAASALAQWAGNFVGGVTFEQVQLASHVLVIAAMGLLAAYFASVRKAFHRFLTSMTGGEMLAGESAALEQEEGDAPRG